MKKVLAALLLMALPALAQEGQHKAANFTYKFDVSSTTLNYCSVAGVGGDPFGSFIRGPGQVETSGDVTTVTGVVAADDVFADVNVGDIFSVRLSNGNTETRVVVTNADADTITVETSLDLTGGYVWNYKNQTCGTTDNDGWVSVAGYSTVQIGFQYDVGDLTNASMTMECKSGAPGALPVRIYPGIASDCGDGTLSGTVCEFGTPGDRLSFKMVDNGFAFCRIGVAYVTTDGASRDELTAVIDVGR